MGSNPVEALIFFFFQASSFQLLKLENLLRWEAILAKLLYKMVIFSPILCAYCAVFVRVFI